MQNARRTLHCKVNRVTEMDEIGPYPRPFALDPISFRPPHERSPVESSAIFLIEGVDVGSLIQEETDHLRRRRGEEERKKHRKTGGIRKRDDSVSRNRKLVVSQVCVCLSLAL